MKKYFKGSRSGVLAVCLCLQVSLTIAPLPVKADQALIEKGERVYNEIAGIGCKGCHGDFGEGDLGVGPFIRGATEGTIRAAIEGIGEMVVVRTAIKEDEIKAVSTYVNYLGTTQVARTLVKRGRFLPEAFSTQPGTHVQIIIKNAGFSEQTFASDKLGIENLTIPARSTKSFIWQASAEEGEYSISCTNCKLKDQLFTIRVDKEARKFHGTTPVGATPETKAAAGKVDASM